MKLSVEKLTEELIEEAMPIISKNHRETGQFEELDIDWATYLSIGEDFVSFVLRNDDGDIVGILFFILSVYPHNKKLVMAQQVTFYIQRQYRKHSVRMIAYSEEYFSGIVDLMIQSARIDTGFCITLAKNGYTAQDITFTKRIQ